MLRAWWFNEFSPWEQIIFDRIIEICKNNYKQFWYTHISTPAVEQNEILTAKSWEDASKQIFWLYWLAQWVSDIKPYSLRFDLTIPFARYILDRRNDITFPFKRFQIQPVWRWERQQRGRYKEFIQSDIDVIWDRTDWKSYLYYDAEVVFMLYKTLSEIINYIWMDEPFQININNRKILVWLIHGLIGYDDTLKRNIFNLIDKYYKIWDAKFKDWLDWLWVELWVANKIFEFVTMNINIWNLKSLIWFVDNDEFNEWIIELYWVLSDIEKFSSANKLKVNYNINFAIVRWLDYYTGTVFESMFINDFWLWSICSGWRYDNLTSYIDQKTSFGWVWWSIWIDRLMVMIQEKYADKFYKKTISDYIFINFEDSYDDILKLAGKFISEWKNIEIYPFADKLKKQFAYIDKKWIRYAVILWKWEKESWIYKIKDMGNWQEQTSKLEY